MAYAVVKDKSPVLPVYNWRILLYVFLNIRRTKFCITSSFVLFTFHVVCVCVCLCLCVGA